MEQAGREHANTTQLMGMATARYAAQPVLLGSAEDGGNTRSGFNGLESAEADCGEGASHFEQLEQHCWKSFRRMRGVFFFSKG